MTTFCARDGRPSAPNQADLPYANGGCCDDCSIWIAHHNFAWTGDDEVTP